MVPAGWVAGGLAIYFPSASTQAIEPLSAIVVPPIPLLVWIKPNFAATAGCHPLVAVILSP